MFQVKIICLQVLKWEYFLGFFAIFDNKLNIFSFSTVGQTKQDILRCQFSRQKLASNIPSKKNLAVTLRFEQNFCRTPFFYLFLLLDLKVKLK